MKLVFLLILVSLFASTAMGSDRVELHGEAKMGHKRRWGELPC